MEEKALKRITRVYVVIDITHHRTDGDKKYMWPGGSWVKCDVFVVVDGERGGLTSSSISSKYYQVG